VCVEIACFLVIILVKEAWSCQDQPPLCYHSCPKWKLKISAHQIMSFCPVTATTKSQKLIAAPKNYEE
jgi:hypothetical protein